MLSPGTAAGKVPRMGYAAWSVFFNGRLGALLFTEL
jgi:hypothetical protein